MESAHKSGGGSAPGAGAGAGAGGDGVLCHACGYQYPNGHPSAKQRRAHRKHCGKPASAAAVEVDEGAGDHDGSELLLPGEGGGDAGGDGNAAERGGGSPGSAPEGGDSAGADPLGNGAGHQVIGDKSAEDCLISSGNIPSEVTAEASSTVDDTPTTEYSEKGSPIEDGDPSEPAVGSEHLQDVPTSAVSPEPEDGAKFSSEISGYETQNSSIVPLESDATGGATSELTNDVARQQDGVAVTGEDGMINTIGESKSSEGKSVQVDELGLSCQDILQTETGEGHSSTVVEEDSGYKNPTASNIEEILSHETELNQQRKHALTDSFGEIANIEPVESSAEKSVGTDDDLLKLGKGGCHSEISDDVKAQQQPDSTSEVTDHLVASKGTYDVEGQHSPPTDESIEAISSTANLTEDISSSGMTMDESMPENVTSGTVIASGVDLVDLSPSATAHEINMVDSANDIDEKRQNEKESVVDLVDLSPSATAHEINMVASTNDVDEKRQNEKDSTDLASSEVKEMVIMDNFEEGQQSKEVIVDPTPHEADSFPSTGNHRENEQNEEVIADNTSYKIHMISTEENEHITEFIENLASEDINAASNRDVEQQDETDVKANHEIDRARSIEATGENNAIAGESNAGTITHDVEDKMPNEEVTSGTISINITDNSINEEKMHNEEMGLGSRDNTVVHGPDSFKEKIYEETTSGHTIDNSPEEKKEENTSADPISHETNVAQTSDNADEEKNGEPAVDPTSSVGAVGSIGDIEDKKQSEGTTADPGSAENATPQGTEDAESSKQNESTNATDEAEVAQGKSITEENEKTEDTASREISTIESRDDLKGATDQNEEIADKEMVTDSDKNHVSLKVLLADKNVETKEKEKKASSKDRVLSFRRRVSKDNVSPVKPGSPKAGEGQQDWNSPARLPVEKKPKGRKQQWVPFICCSSVQ